MAFDAENVFHDGTAITADISPVSTVRSGGSAVLDLKKTPAKGLSVAMIVAADLAEINDTMLVTIEESAAVDSGFVEVARFPLLTKGTGMPGTYILRFQSNKRYIRAKIDITDADVGGDFTVTGVYILLTPYAYSKL